jgi:hypothetical protein
VDQDQNEVVRLVNETFGDELVKVFVTPGKAEKIADPKALVLAPKTADEKKTAEEKKDAEPEEKDPFIGGHSVELSFSAPTRLDTAARSLRTELAKLKTYGDSEDKVKTLIDAQGTERAEQTEEQAKAAIEYNKVTVRFRPDVTPEMSIPS